MWSVNAVTVVKDTALSQRYAHGAEIAFTHHRVIGIAGLLWIAKQLAKEFRNFFHHRAVLVDIALGGKIEQILRVLRKLLRIHLGKAAVAGNAHSQETC